MKRLLRIALLFILIFPFAAKAQNESPYKMISMIRGDVVDFAVDNLDNVYVLASTDQLKKYNSGGDSVAVFNNVKKFGKISTIDVSNPLKVLLYYKDFSTIVVLDRLLAKHFPGKCDRPVL
jgi:glutaredoxin-related protein